MASYRIEWRKSTKNDLRKIEPQAVTRIIEAVESLAENPFPSGYRKLAQSSFAYRIRVGNYRILYEIIDDTLVIEVVKVGHRREIYRK